MGKLKIQEATAMTSEIFVVLFSLCYNAFLGQWEKGQG